MIDPITEIDGSEFKFGPPAVKRLGNVRHTGTSGKALSANMQHQQWTNFNALNGLSRQLRFLLEVFLPPANYGQGQYAWDRIGWFSLLYAQRILRGVIRARETKGGAV